MEIYEKNYKNKDLYLYTYKKHQPYDYKRNGLLNKILPRVIINTKNSTTKTILQFIEHTMIFLMSKVDQLKHFKDWNFD